MRALLRNMPNAGNHEFFMIALDAWFHIVMNLFFITCQSKHYPIYSVWKGINQFPRQNYMLYIQVCAHALLNTVYFEVKPI